MVTHECHTLEKLVRGIEKDSVPGIFFLVAPKKLITNFLRLGVDFLPIIKTCSEDIFAFLVRESTKPALAVTY